MSPDLFSHLGDGALMLVALERLSAAVREVRAKMNGGTTEGLLHEIKEGQIKTNDRLAELIRRVS